MKRQAEKSMVALRDPARKKSPSAAGTTDLECKHYKALIVEDDEETRDFLKTILKHHSFQIVEAWYGQQAVDKCLAERPDLVLLDIRLACGDSGFEVLRKIRENQNGWRMKIIMLTALVDPYLKVAGLSGGADGYLNKPFDQAELVATIKSCFRDYLESNFNGSIGEKSETREMKEKQEDKPDEIKKFGFSVSSKKRESWHHDRRILDFTPKEFEILVYLLKHAPNIVSREQLLEEVWKDAAVESDTVDVHICRLRGKMGSVAANKIQGIAKLGYKISER